LAAAGALALFALNPSGSASAAGLDDSQRLTPQVFNQEAPPDRRGNDNDDCDRNGGGWNGPNGSPSRGGHDDDCDRDDDHDWDDCDRDWDRNGPPGRDRDRDRCDRDDDHDWDDCDRDWGRNDRDRDRDRDRCDRDDDRDRCDRDWGRDWDRDRDCDRDRHDRDRRDYCDRDRKDRDRYGRDCRDRDDSTITIIKDTSPSSNETFSFGGDLGSFTLRDGQSRTFRVDSGTYTVWENHENDWSLDSINCSGDGVVTRSGDGVRIRVSDDDRVTCVFNNEGADEPVKVVSPVVAPQPQIIYVPVPAPQPVVRQVVEVVREPAPAPRPAAPVASLPRTGQGLGFQQEGNLALPLGVLAALSIAGFGYLAVRRVRDTE
jgi:hypothetical protein